MACSPDRLVRIPGRPRVRRGLLRGAVAAPMVVIRIGLALLWSPRIGVILSQVHGHLAGMQSPTSV